MCKQLYNYTLKSQKPKYKKDFNVLSNAKPHYILCGIGKFFFFFLNSWLTAKLAKEYPKKKRSEKIKIHERDGFHPLYQCIGIFDVGYSVAPLSYPQNISVVYKRSIFLKGWLCITCLPPRRNYPLCQWKCIKKSYVFDMQLYNYLRFIVLPRGSFDAPFVSR